MPMEIMIKLLVFMPLVAALITGLSIRLISDRAAQLVTSGGMILSAVLAAFVFKDVVLAHNVYDIHVLQWIKSGELDVSWALKVDSLTAVMFIVVTWVSAVVHVYSIGYMSHDEHKPRFMCYLSLFTFCMLMLVSANNFMQVFFGWEGVGVCSYLLIGFWFKRQSAGAAAIKAFVVNRVGDFGMVLGVFATFVYFGSLNFDEVFGAVPGKASGTLSIFGAEFHAMTVICLLLFVGCMGKSAQFFLHTWLPDAMEGPTPVSALIHAATMVTAGVFLIVRCSPMFEYAPDALAVITVVGAVTAIFAASVGLVQSDIKKSIAYSTCSQLGYMFFACGVSAYGAAVFHLLTHAFFKALLFLGAGSVIHAMSDEQNMFKMGGLRRLIPVTYSLMAIGTLSMIGLPFLSGSYSKNAIIENSFLAGTSAASFAFAIAVFVAMLTSFYSFRLMFLTFSGKSKADHETLHHVHESPVVMLAPLFVLAAGALGAGWLFSEWGILSNPSRFWGSAIFNLHPHGGEHAAHVPHWVHYLVESVVLAGFVLAGIMYGWKTYLPQKVASAFSPLYNFLVHKWYFDELYNAVFVRGANYLGRFFWKKIDIAVIDRFGPDGISGASMCTAAKVVKVQTGYLYHYAFAMLIGLSAIIFYFIFAWVTWG